MPRVVLRFYVIATNVLSFHHKWPVSKLQPRLLTMTSNSSVLMAQRIALSNQPTYEAIPKPWIPISKQSICQLLVAILASSFDVLSQWAICTSF